MSILIKKEVNKTKLIDFLKQNDHLINKFYLGEINEDEILENELNNYFNDNTKIVKYVFDNEDLQCIYSLEKLEWDQGIFNKNMWRLKVVSNVKLMPKTIEVLKEDFYDECKINEIEHVSCQVKSKDYNSAHALEKLGFNIVDTIIRFGTKLTNYRSEANKNNPSDMVLMREYRDSDYEQLLNVAKEAFGNYSNRFLNEGGFKQEDCDKMYLEWIKNSTKGFADLIIVSETENKLVGFSTLKFKHNLGDNEIMVAERQLSGVSEISRGLGLNTKMLLEQLRVISNKATFFEVGTQVYNYASQKTYYKCGLKPIDSYFSFHLAL